MKKIKQYFTLNNSIDLGADVGLLLFDVLGAPVMIPIRIGKWGLKLGIKHSRKIGINQLATKLARN